MKKNTSYRIVLTLLQTVLLIVSATCLTSCKKHDPTPDTSNKPAAVVKTNTDTKVYVHYMPWFRGKPFGPSWGSHWKMTNKNPDNVDENGKREIASFYYPLIGPYDSRDPDVIDYHMLLMKYAGVDGILIDWYGSHSVNDYASNLVNTNSIIERLSATNMQFAIVYEEYTAGNSAGSAGTAIKAAQQDLVYVEKNYFSKELHIQTEGVPLLMTFGPRYFKQASQWTEIFSAIKTKPKFLPLWGQSGQVGQNATGEFSWIDFNADLSGLKKFYNNSQLLNFDFIISSAFPRYHDFYVQGGTGKSNGYVDANNGLTFTNTLDLVKLRKLPYLQVVTWNDFGEGTVIEPTQEDQFSFLESLQKFTGVSYGHDELALIYQYYVKKQQFKSDPEKAKKLDDVFTALNTLKVEDAKSVLSTIE